MEQASGGRRTTMRPVKGWQWIATGLVAVLAFSGCYQSPTAPRLEWSETEVEQLRKEFDRMEWE